jgi:hypothetical protein
LQLLRGEKGGKPMTQNQRRNRVDSMIRTLEMQRTNCELFSAQIENTIKALERLKDEELVAAVQAADELGRGRSCRS